MSVLLFLNTTKGEEVGGKYRLKLRELHGIDVSTYTAADKALVLYHQRHMDAHRAEVVPNETHQFPIKGPLYW